VTGSKGQLGRELCRQLGDRAIGTDLDTLDVTDNLQVRNVLSRNRPSAVIHCAAYTHVDRAESDERRCTAVNADAVGSLARACRDCDSLLVHISTDYVFGGDGLRRSPYRETDVPAPQSVYARSKLAGEQHAASWSRHLIVRTCGLYSAAPGARNFVNTVVARMQAGKLLRVVDDQHCTPSNVVHVARAILFLLEHPGYGIYHVVNRGATTWYGLAREIKRLTRLDCPLEPISTSEYGSPALRPAYSVLDISKYKALGGPPMPTWQEAIAEHLGFPRDGQQEAAMA
jgi:dTDP-4-dehydrorhamnose reductase